MSPTDVRYCHFGVSPVNYSDSDMNQSGRDQGGCKPKLKLCTMEKKSGGRGRGSE